MINSEACPPTVYVKLSFGSNMTRECMSVYQQKAPDSEDFICMSYEEIPIGQHMIDFLIVSTKSLPPIVTKMKNIFKLIQAQNFDHHMVPLYLETIFELYVEVNSLHPWWASSMPLSKLWHDFNDYSFYSIHPSPYLLDTYDEVDRLMDEEYYWRIVCDQLQTYIKWLDVYVEKLAAFNDALACCLDANPPDSLAALNNIQRAFLFRSFFNDQFLDRTPVNILYNLHETYSAPLGKTIHVSRIRRPEETSIFATDRDNMDFKSMVEGKGTALQLDHLAKMIVGKNVVFTQDLVLQSPGDIYSACSLTMYLLVSMGMHIRKCKNCGKYFVPLNRSDEQYCCRVQAGVKMCRELDYEMKINDDNLLTIYRTAYKTHNARKRRNLNNRTNAEKEFREWITFAKQLLERAKSGEISPQEFQELIKK